jgi:hypothetical protein
MVAVTDPESPAAPAAEAPAEPPAAAPTADDQPAAG